MTTKHNWITENIQHRLVDQNSDFVAQLNPYPFEQISFDQAVEQTVHEISKNYKNLYLALSGGYDSDFVMQTFYKHHVPIIPVIVRFGNDLESAYAFETCKKLNVEPVVITVSDDELVSYYEEKIYNTFNGVGFRSTPILVACEHVQKNNGTLIVGEHLIGDGDDMITNKDFAFINEWDFYHTYHYSIPCIDFFLYSAELSYAMMPHHLPNISWAQYKHHLFKIQYRKKIKLEHSDIIKQHIFRLRSNKMCPIKTGVSWSKDEIDKIFNCVLLKK